MNAAVFGYKGIVEELIEGGANISIKNKVSSVCLFCLPTAILDVSVSGPLSYLPMMELKLDKLVQKLCVSVV